MAVIRFVIRWLVRLAAAGAALAALVVAGLAFLTWRALPDVSGTVSRADAPGKIAILRDARAVPHVDAANDAAAYYALGWLHAQDRFWQMEFTRRAVSGRLAEVLGEQALPFDRLVRRLGFRRRAESAYRALSLEARLSLDAYAAGVNAWLDAREDDFARPLAIEMTLLWVDAEPWSPLDSIAILKGLALQLSGDMWEEAARARLARSSGLTPEQIADLFPSYLGEPGLVGPSFAQMIGEAPAAAPANPSAPANPANPADPTNPTNLTVPNDPTDPTSGDAAAPAPTPEFAPPPASDDAAQDTKRHGWRANALDLASRLLLGAPPLNGASNNWVVAPSRAAGGGALLANDPHLGLVAPTFWYMVELKTPNWTVVGGTTPGLPAVLIGRSDCAGWGLTTTMADVQDLYYEQLDPDNPERYRTPDGWATFETKETVIGVRGGDDVTLTLRESRHGPVMSDEKRNFAPATPEGYALSLAWPQLAPGDRSLEAVLGLPRARNFAELRAYIRHYRGPMQNIVWAGCDDKIAFIAPGEVPVRGPDHLSNGLTPTPGWIAANDWTGFIPPEDLPAVEEPADGAIATANQRIIDPNTYPHHLANRWPEPYRYRRILDMLGARDFHSVDGFRAMQMDEQSEMARDMIPVLTALEITDPTAARAQALIADWDGVMRVDRPEPLIFAAWTATVARRLAADELGAQYGDWVGDHAAFIDAVLRRGGAMEAWCDVIATSDAESCAETAANAFVDATTALAAAFGDNPDEWRWSNAHVAVHAHRPFDRIPILRELFSIEQPVGGGVYTVQRQAFDPDAFDPQENPRFTSIHGAGLRVIYDMADPDRSLFVTSTGQSGNPFSAHYRDLGRLWVVGDYAPLTTNRAENRRGAIGELVITPAEP